MSIDRASIFAERYKANPAALQQAVLGVGNQTVTDPYTALRALQLLKQSQSMQSAQAAQAPTNEPSIAAEAVTPQPNQPTQGLNAGLGAMPVPAGNYAVGGMVAFAGGGTPVQHYAVRGLTDSKVSDEDAYFQKAQRGDVGTDDAGTDDTVGPVVAADGVETLLGEGDPDIIKQGIAALQASPETKLGDRDAEISARRKLYEEIGGPDIYKPELERLGLRESEGLKAKDQGLGLSLLKAAAAMTQGNNFLRAAGNAAGAFGDSYHDVLKQSRAEQEHRDAMRFHLADAQRKDKLGQYSLAASATHQGRLEAIAADNARNKKLALQVQLQALANRGKTGGAGSFDVNAFNAKTEANIAKGMSPVKAKEKAADDILSSKQYKNVFSTSDITGNKAEQGETALDIKQQALANQQKKLHGEELRRIKRLPEYLDANPATREQMMEAIDEKYPLARHGKVAGGSTSGGNIAPPSGFVAD